MRIVAPQKLTKINYDVVSSVFEQISSIPVGDLLKVSPLTKRQFVSALRTPRKPKVVPVSIEEPKNASPIIQDLTFVDDDEDRTAIYTDFVINGYKIKTLIDGDAAKPKWDGVGFGVKDRKLTPVLIEFSGGIQFNNTDSKEKRDVNKLVSACIKSIGYTAASTGLTVPVPEFILKSHSISWCTLISILLLVDIRVYLESIIKPVEERYIRRTHTVVPVPARTALLQKFLTKTVDMYYIMEGRSD